LFLLLNCVYFPAKQRRQILLYFETIFFSMDENLFTLLNLILLGMAGLGVFFYLIFLTRKRLSSGYIHPRDNDKTHSPPN